MNQLTLQQLFGTGAIQDAQVLRIDKSDLTMLTPLTNNTAESLLVALLLKAFENFIGILTTENDIPITDDDGNSITYDQGDRFYEFVEFMPWEPYIEQRQALVIRNTIIMHSFISYEVESFA